MAAPDPPVAIGVAFSMWRFWQKRGHLAEARRRLEAMAAAPWSHDDPRLRAKLLEALGGTCWWQGDLPAMAPRYDEALAIWQALGDEAEIANAYYNARSPTPSMSGSGRRPTPTTTRPDCATSSRRATSFAASATGAARATPCGGSATTTTSGERPGNGGGAVPRDARGSSARSATGRWRPGRCTCSGPRSCATGTVDEARGHIAHAIRHFHDAGDASGLTLTLDDLSAVAVADGDLPRAARLRGAARNLTVETGAQLAGYVEDTFETGVRPGVRTQMSSEDLARYGAEGAALDAR